MTSCLEQTSFKLAPGADAAAFVAAAPAITTWAATQPGFQYRCLVDAGDGAYVDYVWWNSEADAKAAAENFMAANGDAPFMAMIDPATVKMAHFDVAHMGMAA